MDANRRLNAPDHLSDKLEALTAQVASSVLGRTVTADAGAFDFDEGEWLRVVEALEPSMRQLLLNELGECPMVDVIINKLLHEGPDWAPLAERVEEFTDLLKSVLPLRVPVQYVDPVRAHLVQLRDEPVMLSSAGWLRVPLLVVNLGEGDEIRDASIEWVTMAHWEDLVTKERLAAFLRGWALALGSGGPGLRGLHAAEMLLDDLRLSTEEQFDSAVSLARWLDSPPDVAPTLPDLADQKSCEPIARNLDFESQLERSPLLERFLVYGTWLSEGRPKRSADCATSLIASQTSAGSHGLAVRETGLLRGPLPVERRRTVPYFSQVVRWVHR